MWWCADVTADKGIEINSEVYMAEISAHIQPNATKRRGRRFPVQMDNNLENTVMET